MLKRSLKRRKHDVPTADEQSSGVVKASTVLGDTQTEKDEEEAILERVVLGGDDDILEKLDEPIATKAKKKKSDSILFEPKAAWQDDEESTTEIKISSKDFRHRYFKHQANTSVSEDTYSQTLRSQFEKVTGQPEWAKLKWQKDEKENSEDEDEVESQNLLQHAGNYLSKSQSLPANILQIKPCKDANRDQPFKCKIKVLEFHPTAQVIMTAGSNNTLALFQVDGKSNPKIQSIYLEDFPIVCGHFTTDGTQVILSSTLRSFKYYDMMSGEVITVPKIKGLHGDKLIHFEMSPDGQHILFRGKYGQMHLISAKSKEWICTLKMNGSVEAVGFSPDGSKMFSHGDDGEVYVWDMKTRDCVHRFVDDGCMKGTSVAVSKNGQYIAAGSYSGVVNIYDESCLSQKRPTPVKAVMNLTSPCTNMVFNSTSEILAVASNYADRAVRMIHLSSMSVFSNYPDKSDKIKIPYCMDFSLNSGYFSIGNNKGQALLYRVKHYGNY